TNFHPYLTREDGRLPMSDFGGVHRYNVTGLVHDMWGFPSNDPKVAYDLLHHLVDKLENKADLLARYKEHYTEDAEILLISFGSSARTALHVVEQRRQRGLKIGKPIVFNICMLGALIELTGLVKPDSILAVLKEKIGPDFMTMNQEALGTGIQLTRAT
ncbi:MAG: hypothetical protein JRD04_03915, partial [Deltaproteobacteria bacterium]|nr:hypothetical protein [Deltaproteobacteria bacterium]